jgi:hypothetical protein
MDTGVHTPNKHNKLGFQHVVTKEGPFIKEGSVDASGRGELDNGQ